VDSELRPRLHPGGGTISAAKGCTPDEVAIVFLIDGTRVIFPEGPRRVLLDAIAAWQQRDLADGRCSVSVVGGPPLFDVACNHVRPTAALQLRPLVEIPRHLADEIANDACLDRNRKVELLAYIGAAGGHPRTLKRIADAIESPDDQIPLPAPNSARGLACAWDVFAASGLAGGGGYSVNARDLATAPEYEFHRLLLSSNCLQYIVSTSEVAQHDAPQRITLTAAPSALFFSEDDVWTGRGDKGFPSYDAVMAVRTLMQEPGDVAGKWAFAFAGALHLTAQGVLRARFTEAATPRRVGHQQQQQQQQELRGSVPFKDLMPDAIIGCQCADLQYVVRGEFAQAVDRALFRDDFENLRVASCLHSQASDDQAPIQYALAAECGGEDAILVGTRLKCHVDAGTHPPVDEWFEAAARCMRDGHPKCGKNFCVLLCVTGISQEALDNLKTRAANKDDRLSRAIIIDPASASQFFERFGLSIIVEASKLSPVSSKAAAKMTKNTM
jgi:hypothetical protein